MEAIFREAIQLSKIKKYAQSIQLLKITPGIDNLSAVEILIELQDINCFETAVQLVAYLELTAFQYFSREHIRRSHIKYEGYGRIRINRAKFF